MFKKRTSGLGWIIVVWDMLGSNDYYYVQQRNPDDQKKIDQSTGTLKNHNVTFAPFKLLWFLQTTVVCKSLELDLTPNLEDGAETKERTVRTYGITS